ncbi:MAG: choice-of-anchor B family protein [Phycisphaerales bacterium]
MKRTTLAVLVAGAAVTLVALAHPGHNHEADAQQPWSGPAWNIENGTPPPLNFPSNNVQLLAWLPLTQLANGLSSANTCWGYVSPSGREYAIIGTNATTCFVEVTNPANPVVVANITGPVSLWRDMKIYQNFCYAVSEGGGGIQIMNLANIDNGVVTLVGTVNTPDTAATHTMFINEQSGYLYRCGGQGFSNGPGGLRVYSLANPAAPAFVGQWTPRYVHETQVVSYTTGPFAGREIAFCFANDTGTGVNPAVDIVDVTNKSNIFLVSRVTYPNARFSHQGWLSPDRQFLYLNDELDEQDLNLPTLTRVFNVSNIAAPFFVGTFGNGGGAIDHNLYTKGNRIYESNYRSGLRVFDATNPTSPTEIAFFDTYPDNDGDNFNGLWNNYPFFPSNIVIGSDIEKGLFVWWVGPQQLSFDSSNPANPNPAPPVGTNIKVKVTGLNGASVQPNTVQLWYSVNGGSGTTLPMTATGVPDQFGASLPNLPCGGQITYYFSAKADNGIQFRYPGTVFTANVAYDTTTTFAENFEVDNGWSTLTAGDNATAGRWVRVDPNGTAAQPENDNPAGTGTLCFVTGQGTVNGTVGEADVDGGTTTLTSPVLNATGGPPAADAYISYYRWYSNNTGAAPNSDSMPVQISNNNGTNWVQLELVTENAGEWRPKQFRIADFVTPTSQMRVRFLARDLGSGSIVEAGVDDVEIVFLDCAPPPPSCQGDLNGDNAVNVADLTIFLGQFGQAGAGLSGDLNGDNVVNVADLTLFLGRFGVAC